MGINERKFNSDAVAYEIIGPGEYYVPVVLLYTADKTIAEDYFTALCERAHLMDQKGMEAVPYCMYEVTRKPVRSLISLSNNVVPGDQPNA